MVQQFIDASTAIPEAAEDIETLYGNKHSRPFLIVFLCRLYIAGVQDGMRLEEMKQKGDKVNA